MPRELFIVARDRPDLYRYLSQTFADADNVQVVWDRRAAADERRRNGPAAGAERRQDERRGRPQVEADLRTVGYAFLSVS